MITFKVPFIFPILEESKTQGVSPSSGTCCFALWFDILVTMRLLKSSTIELEAFFETVPPYVILSHTWETEEVSFQELQHKAAKKMRGYAKIRSYCAQAVLDGYEYVWIDTCCINKTSSAELSEAINLMYSWYQNAEVCYAYLADVPKDDDLSQASAFRASRWFTRG